MDLLPAKKIDCLSWGKPIPIFSPFQSSHKMNYQDLFQNWNQRKESLKKMYGHLADHDLVLEEGQAYELFARLQRKLRKSETQMIDILLHATKSPLLK